MGRPRASMGFFLLCVDLCIFKFLFWTSISTGIVYLWHVSLVVNIEPLLAEAQIHPGVWINSGV